MKNTICIAGLLTLLLFAQIAAGQAPSEQRTPPPTSTINLTVEDRHTIKEFVKDEPAKAPADTPAAVGGPAPAGVNLRPFPADLAGKVPQIKSHVYFLKGSQVVIVDPKDNTVAEVIE